MVGWEGTAQRVDVSFPAFRRGEGLEYTQIDKVRQPLLRRGERGGGGGGYNES